MGKLTGQLVKIPRKIDRRPHQCIISSPHQYAEVTRIQLQHRWYLNGILNGMRTTIDRAGRLVIPKSLRDRLGLRPGEVEVTADGAALRVQPVTSDALAAEGAWLVVPGTGERLGVDDVQHLRDADQK
jgi:AbrB family looped-hinge helix DNA binding protein